MLDFSVHIMQIISIISLIISIILFYFQASWTEGYSGRISAGPHVGPFGGNNNHIHDHYHRDEESGQEPKTVNIGKINIVASVIFFIRLLLTLFYYMN